MADKAILTTLPKLNSSNWFEWKKEVETFLLLAGLDRIIDAEDIQTGTKATEWMAKDRKKLVAEYEKDSVTTRMALCQQFYSLTHNPAVGIAVFIDTVFLIVRQPGAIGHKPDDLEISDKLLIGLHQSWTPVRTVLTLHEKPRSPKSN